MARAVHAVVASVTLALAAGTAAADDEAVRVGLDPGWRPSAEMTGLVASYREPGSETTSVGGRAMARIGPLDGFSLALGVRHLPIVARDFEGPEADPPDGSFTTFEAAVGFTGRIADRTYLRPEVGVCVGNYTEHDRGPEDHAVHGINAGLSLTRFLTRSIVATAGVRLYADGISNYVSDKGPWGIGKTLVSVAPELGVGYRF